MKSSDEFPLWKHSSGRFCKKIQGKFHYFGPISDPDGALSATVNLSPQK